MQHKHKLSDFRDTSDGDKFLYGFGDQFAEEPEDEPIAIHSGMSMPVWKTPSVLNERPAEASGPVSLHPVEADPAFPDSGNKSAEFADFEDADLSDYDEDLPSAKATILFEKPMAPSLWKRFTSFVSRYMPAISDESSIQRLNIYLGATAFFVALVILIVVLVTRPSL